MWFGFSRFGCGFRVPQPIRLVFEGLAGPQGLPVRGLPVRGSPVRRFPSRRATSQSLREATTLFCFRYLPKSRIEVHPLGLLSAPSDHSLLLCRRKGGQRCSHEEMCLVCIRSLSAWRSWPSPTRSSGWHRLPRRGEFGESRSGSHQNAGFEFPAEKERQMGPRCGCHACGPGQPVCGAGSNVRRYPWSLGSSHQKFLATADLFRSRRTAARRCSTMCAVIRGRSATFRLRPRSTESRF